MKWKSSIQNSDQFFFSSLLYWLIPTNKIRPFSFQSFDSSLNVIRPIDPFVKWFLANLHTTEKFSTERHLTKQNSVKCYLAKRIQPEDSDQMSFRPNGMHPNDPLSQSVYDQAIFVHMIQPREICQSSSNAMFLWQHNIQIAHHAVTDSLFSLSNMKSPKNSDCS